MKILVCVKQVPDLESRFRINDQGNWYQDADLAWRMNEYDEFAVEQAVQLKEQLGDSDLTVLSLGPKRVREIIKKGLAMGGDRGVHLIDKPQHKDPFQIASFIYQFARDKEFEVIFTGMQSQDRGSAQVGILLAEMLGITAITTVVSFSFQDSVITAKRELEGGTRSVVKLLPPALISCQLGLNTPRYPTLPNIMKAKRKELLTIQVEELSQIMPLIATERMFLPKKKIGAIILEGDNAEIADRLISILAEKTTVFN